MCVCLFVSLRERKRNWEGERGEKFVAGKSKDIVACMDRERFPFNVFVINRSFI
jgi:hypothetical protein